jgi:cell division protein FtsI/penicillin-binding protein 2
MEKRLWAAALFIGLGLVLVAGRLVQLTVIQHRELAARAASQHHKRISWTSQRGTIVDRNGTPLALSVAAESLSCPSRSAAGPD